MDFTYKIPMKPARGYVCRADALKGEAFSCKKSDKEIEDIEKKKRWVMILLK